ncbi:MAG: putative membrane protein [Psychromonas sp.]|jgi:predicted membrane protein
MASSSIIIWSLLFSSIGMGFFIYGKKQRAIVPLCAGLALIIFPYFMTSVLMLLVVGITLIAIPYFIRL